MTNLIEKAKLIRLLIFDVDGVLTSGTLFYGNEEMDIKGFFVQDGLGIKLLKKTGVDVAIISSKQSQGVIRRMKDLDLQHVYLGKSNKLPVYEELKSKLQLEDHQIAYAGDDLPDLPILKRVGLAITVPHAYHLLHEHADMVTNHEAGKGAAREICDLIMKAQDTYHHSIKPYLL